MPFFLYCKTEKVSVLSPPHFSFSTGTDLTGVDGRSLDKLSEVLTSAKRPQISRCTASLCGLSAMYVLSGSKIFFLHPRVLVYSIVKIRRFLVYSCK